MKKCKTFIAFVAMLFITLTIQAQQNDINVINKTVGIKNNTTPASKSNASTDKNFTSIRTLIIPKVETVLSSQVAGRVIKVNAELGSSFHKGQILIEFDCNIQSALYGKARADLKAAESKHKSNLRLNELKSISNLDLQVSEADLDKAKASLAVEWARLKMCKIKAPFNGRVIKRKVQPYESVSQGQPLLEILNDSSLELELYVPSSWLSWIKKGIIFTIQVDETGKEYPAKIISLGASVDPVSHTIGAKAVIIGKHKELLSGMSGEARFKNR